MDHKPAVLVIAPHHDDEVIGCGGTMAFLRTRGVAVDVVYMTSGYAGIPSLADQQAAIDLRESEARESGEILGVRELIFLRHPDRSLVYCLEYVRQLVGILRQGHYSGVYFPHPAERDIEHRVVNKIAGEAAWLARTAYFPELGSPLQLERTLMYEVWTPLQTVNFKQDISPFLDDKIKALSAYRSQFETEQPSGIVGLNRYRGAMSGTPMLAAEAFQFYAR